MTWFGVAGFARGKSGQVSACHAWRVLGKRRRWEVESVDSEPGLGMRSLSATDSGMASVFPETCEVARQAVPPEVVPPEVQALGERIEMNVHVDLAFNVSAGCRAGVGRPLVAGDRSRQRLSLSRRLPCLAGAPGDQEGLPLDERRDAGSAGTPDGESRDCCAGPLSVRGLTARLRPCNPPSTKAAKRKRRLRGCGRRGADGMARTGNRGDGGTRHIGTFVEIRLGGFGCRILWKIPADSRYSPGRRQRTAGGRGTFRRNWGGSVVIIRMSSARGPRFRRSAIGTHRADGRTPEVRAR